MDQIGFPLFLSVKVAVFSTFFSGIFGIIAGYFIYSRKFRGKEILDTLITVPMVLPPTVTGLYLMMIFGRNGILGGILYDLTGISIMFSWQAAVFASFFVSAPITFKTTRSAFEAVDKNLVEISFVLGKSELRTFFLIIFPLAWKGIAAGLVLAFARALGEFGATLMLAGNIEGKTNTVPLAIYTLATSGKETDAHILALIFVLFAFLFLYLIKKLGKQHA
ncbi:MAG: molybdate ABC transporter permease subunit [bacterium]|jgi:molybdate transport system permease protein|nr:molybdate ABC transporter permease subunit [bacterium]